MKLQYGFTFPVFVSLFSLSVVLTAQSTFPAGQLDPTRNIASPQLADQGHRRCRSNISGVPSTARRPKWKRSSVVFARGIPSEDDPRQATLYVAGAEASTAYIDGKLVDKVQDNPASPLEMPMFETDISGKLHVGKNVLALKITPRGDDDQLVVKIVPSAAAWMYRRC